MKLCSICDKKIEGTWCKNCHRFVKVYDLSDDIHFNASHDPGNDADCTYHTDVRRNETATNTTVTRDAGTTRSQQTYTRTVTSTGGATGTTRTSGGKKKGKGKLAVVLIILYLIFNLIGALVPTITDCVGALSKELEESFLEEEKEDESFADTPLQKDVGYEEKLAAIEKLVPVETQKEADYEYRYYDPRDIVTLGFACDEAHFDVTVPEFDEWLEEHWTDEYELEEGISEYTNFYYEDEEGTWLYFALFRDYYVNGEVSVRVDYDTATQKLHRFGFAALDKEDIIQLSYEALKEFDPETDWTQSFFKRNIKDALNGELYETITFYASDELKIDAQVNDGYYSIAFYPTYE